MMYIADTNIISAILKGNSKARKEVVKAMLSGHEIVISCISYYEIKRGLQASKASTQLKKFDNFCKSHRLLYLKNKRVFDTASIIWAGLKNKGNLLEDADILIASMTLCNNSTLVSHDNDFDRIEGLNREDWLT